jgi:hypothetical protein
MDFAGDIAKLRKEGVSDDDILTTYRSIAPNDSSDIDKLQGEGVHAKDILDTIASRGPAPKPEALPQDSDGFWDTQRKRLQFGAGAGIEAVGSTLRNTTGDGVGAEKLGRDLKPEGYVSSSARFMKNGERKHWADFDYQHLPGAAVEALPALAAGAGAALGGWVPALGMGALMNFGPSLDQRRENNGGMALTGTDYALAGGSALAAGALDKLGIGGITGATMKGAGVAGLKTIPKAVGKAAVAEGATEGGQSVIDQALTSVGTDKGLSVDPGQAIGEGLVGAAVGGGARTAGALGDARNAARWAGGDQDSHTRVADRFASSGVDIESSTDQSKALNTVKSIIDKDIARSKKDAKGVLDQTGGQEAVDTALAILRNKETLTAEHKAGLEEALARHDDGLKLLKDITDLDTLNQLRKTGTEDQGHFDGGIVGKWGGALNPMRLGKSILGKTAGGISAASALELPFAAQLGITAPAIAKFLAAQSAAYAGAKGIDKVMGNSNPVRTFRDQFSGLGTKNPEINNPVQSTGDLKALAKQAALNRKLNKKGLTPVQESADEVVREQPEPSNSLKDRPGPIEDLIQSEGVWKQADENLNAPQVERLAPPKPEKTSKESTVEPEEGAPPDYKEKFDIDGKTFYVPSDVVNVDRFKVGIKRNQEALKKVTAELLTGMFHQETGEDLGSLAYERVYRASRADEAIAKFEALMVEAGASKLAAREAAEAFSESVKKIYSKHKAKSE